MKSHVVGELTAQKSTSDTSHSPLPFKLVVKNLSRDFPGGAVVKNPPANSGFEPWAGKIPHAAEQLRPCATTTEPAL